MSNARGAKRAAYQAAYNAKPENVAKRVQNNAARREAIRDGKVHVGDNKDVDHVKPLENGGSNAKSNLRVTDETTNRGWRKGSGSYNPGKQKK